MSTNTHLVFNITDGFFASPDEMTKEEAERFVKEFPERFKFQGYYRDSRGQRIPPEEVILKIIPSDKVGEKMKYLLQETEDNRNKELIKVPNHKVEKGKDKGRSL